MSLPKSYKRAVFKEAGGDLIVEDVELSMPGKGEVLVKVQACGVCHSDAFVQMNAMGGGFPLVPGHEIIGHVAAVGDGADWKVGDRVGGAWHGGHDGSCKACHKGLYQMCDNRTVNGILRDGGYAEYCKLRTEAVVPVPENLDAAKYAPILCAGVTVFNAMRNMNIPPGSTVAIQGLGGLGHLALQYANKFGYRVVAISRDAKKEKFARQLGAHEYVDTSKGDAGEQLQKLGGAAMVVATAPNAEVIAPLLKGLDILGKLLILAVPGDLTLDAVTMIGKGLSVQAWPSGHAIDCADAITFTEIQGIDCMIEKFPLAKAPEAYKHMMDGKPHFRAVITMD